MNASPNFAEALPTLNSMALSFNVYPLALDYVEKRRIELGSPSLLAHDLTLLIVHGILLVQASLTLVLKISYRSKSGKLWIWRKQYLLDQTTPYFIPNGQFIIEPLQILGCIFFELFTVVVYIATRWPDTASKLPNLHATCLLWLAVSLVPGFIGFWWSGWSAFYALFLTPTHTSRSNHGQFARIYYYPILMNAVCIGVPVLISLFFITIGVFLTVKHLKVGEEYATFLMQLRHLSETWKPNDPNTVDNNLRLFAILQRVLAEGGAILDNFQFMAIGWAITAVIIILFYTSTAISVGKVTRRTLKLATGRATLITYDSKDAKSTSQADTLGCEDELESKAESNHPPASQPSQQPVIMKSVSALSLQRNLYFLRASCGLMIISLGFNFCVGVIFATKVRSLLMETYWQNALASIITIGCIVLSFSLFVQSLIHVQH